MDFLHGDEMTSYGTGHHMTMVDEQALYYGQSVPSSKEEASPIELTSYIDVTSLARKNANKRQVVDIMSTSLMAGGCATMKTGHVISRDVTHYDFPLEGTTINGLNVDHVTRIGQIMGCPSVDPLDNTSYNSDDVQYESGLSNDDVIGYVHYPDIMTDIVDNRTIIEESWLEEITSSGYPSSSSSLLSSS